eukprot:15344023-Ditylum_brightwellii.AAC.1
MYNILKKLYRSSNVYTFKQLIELLNENEHTTATPVQSSDFHDYDKFLDNLYKRFPSGTVTKNHIFSVDASKDPKMMTLEVSSLPEDDGYKITKDFYKPRTDEQRKQLLRAPLVQLKPPGIPLIKQIELGTKWRENVPVEFQNEICPLPPE